jgi:glutathione S-transferase
MYAPVVLRLTLYRVTLPAAARSYADAMLALPSLQQWLTDARSETEVLAQFER